MCRSITVACANIPCGVDVISPEPRFPEKKWQVTAHILNCGAIDHYIDLRQHGRKPGISQVTAQIDGTMFICRQNLMRVFPELSKTLFSQKTGGAGDQYPHKSSRIIVGSASCQRQQAVV